MDTDYKIRKFQPFQLDMVGTRFFLALVLVHLDTVYKIRKFQPFQMDMIGTRFFLNLVLVQMDTVYKNRQLQRVSIEYMLAVVLLAAPQSLALVAE